MSEVPKSATKTPNKRKKYSIELKFIGKVHWKSSLCYKRGRVILEVVLNEYSKNTFSHYIRGRVVIEVVLFSGLYGIANPLIRILSSLVCILAQNVH